MIETLATGCTGADVCCAGALLLFAAAVATIWGLRTTRPVIVLFCRVGRAASHPILFRRTTR
jgi:hypothetical protein